jgi:hypothetical protein
MTLGGTTVTVVEMGIGRFGLRIHDPLLWDVVEIWEQIERERSGGIICAGFMIDP